jgi:transcription antitermination factor NusG
VNGAVDMLTASPDIQTLSEGDGSRWAVFQTQARLEVQAAQNLRDQGFRIFLPVQTVKVRHARKVSEKKAALFPGYGFVAIHSGVRWRSINGTRGVKRLITAADAPLFLPAGFVGELSALIADDGTIDLGSTFATGERARILSGPFAGLIGTIAGLDGRGRASLLIALLSGEVLVSLSTASLTRAS